MTNFFKQIAAIDFYGALHIIIAKGTGNSLVVSVLPQNDQCGDNAKQLIPPLNFTADAEKIDEIFFDQVAAPIQAASTLMVDMENFLKQLEEVKKQSAMEKEKTVREKNEKEAKIKKFKETMSQVDELEKQGKFREAWMKLPNCDDYPDKAQDIRKRKTELSDKFSAPNLFGG